MKSDEIHEMSTRDIKQKLEDSRQELFNLRFQIATRKIKNHQRIPSVKRDIARLMTALRERELAAEYAGVPLDEDETETPAFAATPAARGGGLLGRFRRGGR